MPSIDAAAVTRVRISPSAFAVAVIVSGTVFCGVASADTMIVGYPENTSSTTGVTNIELRPRYAIVQQEGKEEAKAGTVRAMVGYATPQADGIGVTLELIGVGALNSAGYNVPVEPLPSGSNPAHATILDPEAFNANQAYVSYDGIGGTRILAGRQLIELDDQRFVGNVGFRQNMQTYDGISVVNRGLPDFKVMGTYLFGAKSVLNNEVRMKTFLAEASWTRYGAVRVNVFGYWYGNRENAYGAATTGNAAIIPGAALCGAGANSANSLVDPQACNSATYGARVHGNFPLTGIWRGSYAAEYAHQSAWDGGYGALGSGFDHLSVTVRGADVYVSADAMRMGANASGTYGFQTPMATKHNFMGWAEMFLTTPKEGLRSHYVTLGDKRLWGFDMSVRYYRFTTDYQGMGLGHEWDWSIGHALTRNTRFVFQVAKFSVDAAGASSYADLQAGAPGGLENTTAAWGMLTAAF